MRLAALLLAVALVSCNRGGRRSDFEEFPPDDEGKREPADAANGEPVEPDPPATAETPVEPAKPKKAAPPPGGESEAREPNETPAQAMEITPGTPIHAAISSRADKDYFKVSVASDEALLIEVVDGKTDTCKSERIDTFVNVYDEAGKVIAEDDDDGVAMCSRVALANLDTATYTILVRFPPDSVAKPYDYTLDVRLVTPDVVRESEPNNTARRALSISASGAVLALGSHPDATDPDFYAFTLDGAEHVRVDTVGDGADSCAGDIDNGLKLLDAAGNTVLSDGDGGLFFCSMIEKDLPAGQYFLEARASPVAAARKFPWGYGLLFLFGDVE